MTQAASVPRSPPRLGFGTKTLYGVGSVAFGVSSLGLSSSDFGFAAGIFFSTGTQQFKLSTFFDPISYFSTDSE